MWLINGETGWDSNSPILKNSLVSLSIVEDNTVKPFTFGREKTLKFWSPVLNRCGTLGNREFSLIFSSKLKEMTMTLANDQYLENA